MYQPLVRKCEVCGAEFTAKTKDIRRGYGKTCSHACGSILAARKRQVVTPEATRQQKQAANGVVNMRIRRGAMKRPDACQECGKVGRVDAHHDDYGKKDEVVFLCRSCHMKRHWSKHEATQG